MGKKKYYCKNIYRFGLKDWCSHYKNEKPPEGFTVALGKGLKFVDYEKDLIEVWLWFEDKAYLDEKLDFWDRVPMTPEEVRRFKQMEKAIKLMER